MTKNANKRGKSKLKLNIAIIVALIGLAGTIIASLLELLPVYVPKTSPPMTTLTQTHLSSTLTSTFIPNTTPNMTGKITPSFIASPRLDPSSTCDLDLADRLFTYVLTESRDLFSALGNPVMQDPLCILETTYQPFQGGEMIWRADDHDIYVLFSNGEWKSYQNNFRSAEETSCHLNTPLPSSNQSVPERGFGKIWCENPNVMNRLNYARIQEIYKPRAVLHFEGGWLILIDSTVRAILQQEKQWTSIDVSNFEPVSLETRPDLDLKKINLGLELQGFVPLPKAPLKIIDPLTGREVSVPFDVGPKVSTQCADTIQHPDVIEIPVNISHPVEVHLLVQAGWGLEMYRNKTIGTVAMKFDNGDSLETDLRLGFNIRDWANREDAITTLESTDAQTAWEGFDGEIPGVIDLLSINIPENYFSSTLKQIIIEDRSIASIQDMNPCIHLSGVTVSYLPLP